MRALAGFQGNDSSVSCVAVGEFREVHYGYSPAYYNERHWIKEVRHYQ